MLPFFLILIVLSAFSQAIKGQISANIISANVMYWEPTVPTVYLPSNKPFLFQLNALTLCDSANDTSCELFSVTSPQVGLLIYQNSQQYFSGTVDPTKQCSVFDAVSGTRFDSLQFFSAIPPWLNGALNISGNALLVNLPSPSSYFTNQTNGSVEYSLIINCEIPTGDELFFSIMAFNNGTTTSASTLSNSNFTYSLVTIIQNIFQSI